MTRRTSSIEGGLDIWTPITSIDLKNDNWSRGWNDIALQTGWTTFPSTFEAREGMLVGCATIDWHHGTDIIAVSSEGLTTYVQGGFQWWSEWGVFVNDVLVARSGFIYPKRHTTQLPFSIPCGSQPVSITVKWISNIGNLVPATGFTVATPDPHGTSFDIFGATIWTRNIFR